MHPWHVGISYLIDATTYQITIDHNTLVTSLALSLLSVRLPRNNYCTDSQV